MSNFKSIGLIGLDTSHVKSFAEIFNDPAYEHHIPGFKVTHGYPGASPDMGVSANRVERFTQLLETDYGVEILDSPEALAQKVDIVCISSVDGRAHRGFFERTAPWGKPTFIDKPFAATLADAQAMVRLAQEKNIPIATCSSLRFADRLCEALAASQADDPVLAVDVYGPMELQPQLPGLLWYGVHAVEIIIRVMGPGCVNVQTTTSELQDVVVGQWPDGRLATYHGLRKGHNKFGLLIHRKSGAQFVDASACSTPRHVSMHRQIMPALLKGESAVPVEDSLSVMAFIEAANISREHEGKVVATTPIDMA